MQRIVTIIQEERHRLESHLFFSWLRDDSVPLSERFSFSPVLADFIMGFADLNKWFFKYCNPSTQLQHCLNEHASEDQTHSRLFVEEWEKLEFDRSLRWTARDTLWWWFWCRETEVIRRSAMETLGLAEKNKDPSVRFAMIEAIETCGNVFFSRTCPVAIDFEQETGVRLDYFGVYHLKREDGHLRSDEDGFLEIELDDEQFSRAEHITKRIFELFRQELDQLLSYVQRKSQNEEALKRSLREEYEEHVAPSACLPSPPPIRFSSSLSIPNTTQRAVQQHFNTKLEELRSHQFIQWLRAAPSTTGLESSIAAVETLRRFTPLWAINALGYKDFNLFILRYQDAKSPEERAINRWTELLASYGKLYLQDWTSLGLDDFLGWDSKTTIEEYFLGEKSEIHREAMARVKKRAFANDSAKMRYWLIRSLEEGGHVLFDGLKNTVTAAEKTLRVPLNYWAGRHHLAHPELPPDLEAEQIQFTELSLTHLERQSILETIDVVFTGLEQQFELSMLVASGERQSEISPQPPPAIPVLEFAG